MLISRLSQIGNVLIFILILLIILGLLSISLFSNSLQVSKNNKAFQKIHTAFYDTEACLLQAKYYFNHLNKKIIVSPNCQNTDCINLYNYTIQLSQQTLTWWKTHGVSCNNGIWQYRELLTKKSAHQAIYRISVYNTQHIMLQLYIDKNFSSPNKTIYSWRRIY